MHIKESVLDGCGSSSDAVSRILSERGCLVTTNDVNRCEWHTVALVIGANVVVNTAVSSNYFTQFTPHRKRCVSTVSVYLVRIVSYEVTLTKKIR